MATKSTARNENWLQKVQPRRREQQEKWFLRQSVATKSIAILSSWLQKVQPTSNIGYKKCSHMKYIRGFRGFQPLTSCDRTATSLLRNLPCIIFHSKCSPRYENCTISKARIKRKSEFRNYIFVIYRSMVTATYYQFKCR